MTIVCVSSVCYAKDLLRIVFVLFCLCLAFVMSSYVSVNNLVSMYIVYITDILTKNVVMQSFRIQKDTYWYII